MGPAGCHWARAGLRVTAGPPNELRVCWAVSARAADVDASLRTGRAMLQAAWEQQLGNLLGSFVPCCFRASPF